MSGSTSSIRNRIKSINSTKKITGAMKSVSTVKLNRMTKVTLKNNEYQDVLTKAVDALLSSNIDFDSQYCMKNEGPSLYIVFSSDVGLCGSYNQSLVDYIKKNVTQKDMLYVVGTSIYNSLKVAGYNIINDLMTSDDVDYYKTVVMYNTVLNMFLNKEVSSINVIYNRFVNSITYETVNSAMLPFEKKKTERSEEILLEPNPEEIFDMTIDLCLKSNLYNLFLNSKTSEQVARRYAMENATNNAEDLISDLTLEYNKARQGSITQEITEIVSGANAL